MNTAAHEIKLIHIGRTALQMDEDSYRALIASKGNGATSSKSLTAPQRQAVLAHMKACGFKPKAQPGSAAARANGWARSPEVTKLRALWWALADAQAVTRPESHQACDDAINAWAVRQLSTAAVPLEALRFASSEQMQALIEALKQWARRTGAQVGRKPVAMAAGRRVGG
jgi:phage gp16-like protein